MEETNLLLHRYPPLPVKKVPKLCEFYQMGREVNIDPTDERTRAPAPTIKDGRLCDQEKSSTIHSEQMYTIRGAGQRQTTKVHFPCLKDRETGRRKIRATPTKLPYLKHQKPTKKPAGERRYQSLPSEYTQLQIYQRTRELHDHPLTKEEAKTVEKTVKIKKTSSIEPKKVETMRKHSLLLSKRSSGMDQRIMEALIADPAAIRMVRRNPAVVLNQLRQELKPGELTRFLDEVMRETGGKKAKGLFLQALQKAVILEKEAKQQRPQSLSK